MSSKLRETQIIEDGDAYVQGIHKRFTYRLHDLSELMKTFLQRFRRKDSSRREFLRDE